MLYMKGTLPSRRDYDGRFAAYETVNGLPNTSIVLGRLLGGAYNVGRIMRRHYWKFRVLSELPIECPDIGSMTSSWERTFYKRTGGLEDAGSELLAISIMIRYKTKPNMLRAMHVTV
jgi:hypothetical protein